MKLIALGWCMAKLDTCNGKLTFMSPSEENEHGYIPAESVTLYNKVHLEALRDALIEAYPVEGEKP